MKLKTDDEVIKELAEYAIKVTGSKQDALDMCEDRSRLHHQYKNELIDRGFPLDKPPVTSESILAYQWEMAGYLIV
jgi:hypothetical protein